MNDNREMIVLNGEQIDELVRCKDCKYFEEIMIARYRDGSTVEFQNCKKHVPLKDEYFYCGYGERKDEVENERI